MMRENMGTIEVPFRDDMKEAILAGTKTRTSRNHKLGKEGDTFVLETRTFKISKIEKMPLGEVRDKLYKEEGFGSPEEFVRVWDELHPKRKFSPTKNIWVHSIEEVKVEEARDDNGA